MPCTDPQLAPGYLLDRIQQPLHSYPAAQPDLLQDLGAFSGHHMEQAPSQRPSAAAQVSLILHNVPRLCRIMSLPAVLHGLDGW